MTSTGLHQKSVKSGLRPPCFSRRTGGSGHAQCSGQELSSALPRYDAKPARFALNQDSRKLYSGGVTCPGLIRCAGLEQYQFDTSGRERLQLGLIQKKTYMYLKMKSSTMSRINLNLTENYAPSWKTWEGMRELVQNWHDGILEVAQDNGCSISDGHLVFKKYEDSDTIVYHAIPRNRGIDLNEPLSITGSLLYQKSLERVIFINSRTKLHRKILLMGYSKKLKSSNIIGQFGEGLKVGALALVRQGRAVSMVTSSDWWEFELVQDSIYGETVLSVDVRMRNEATSDGIICLNNSRFLNNLPSLSDSTGTFTIVSKISQDEWISFCKKFLFLEVPEERIETELGTLLLGSEHKGQLYVKGVWVSDLLKDGLMTGVNFHNLRMDRDRRAVIHFSDIDHQISCMWVKAVEKHPKLVEKYFDLLNENTSSDIKHSTFYLKDSVCLEAIRSHFCKLYGDKAYPVTADITADKLVQLRKQVQTKIVVLNQNLVNILYLTGKFTSLEVLLQGRPQDLGIKHYVPFHALSGREMSVLMHVQSLVKNVDQTVSLSSFNIVADIEDKPNVRTFICSDNCKRIEIPRTLLVSEKVHLWEGECQEKDKCMCCETLITLQVLDQLSPSLMTGK